MAENIMRQAVLAIIVNNENQILIGSSPRDGGYKFPQGGLNRGESPVEGLIREIEEELGTVLKEGDIIGKIEDRVHYYYPESESLRNDFIGQEFYIFKIRFNDSMNPVPQDDEFDQLLWIKAEDLVKYETHHRASAYEKALHYCEML